LLDPTTESQEAERLGLVVCQLPWTAAARAAGLRRHALYLVRPDGYLALVDPRQRVDRLLAVWASLSEPGRKG